MQERWLVFAYGEEPWEPLTPQPPAGFGEVPNIDFPTPMLSPSSSFSYGSPSKSMTGSAFGAYFTPSDSSRSSSYSHTASLHLDAFPPADPGSRSAAAMSPFLTSGAHKANAHGHMHQPLTRGGHHHIHHHHHHSHFANGKRPPSSPEHQPISISEYGQGLRVWTGGRDRLAEREDLCGEEACACVEGGTRSAWACSTAQKVGLELGNGPPVNSARF